jgi:CHAT domain-containing protein
LRDALERQTGTLDELPLVVVHDPVASQLPWESLRVGNWVPALAGGLTRQHLDANMSVAKWLEERVDDGRLDVLLVTNPTSDLAGAEGEGLALRALLNQLSNVRVTVRHRSEATKAQLLADFRSGQFDVVHYAGHASFSPLHPGRSGLLCAGHEVLAGTDLAGLSNLPALVFFNACESGRVRGGGAKPKSSAIRRPRVDNVSVASAFIRGGAANFLGTYWPVDDAAAKTFAQTFYPLLVQGRTIGDAVLAGRRAVKAAASVDWADYLLYGNPDFVLKRAKG